MARRNALPQDKTLLSAEPMFCFETAVKMLYWSAFVYELDEVCAFRSHDCCNALDSGHMTAVMHLIQVMTRLVGGS